MKKLSFLLFILFLSCHEPTLSKDFKGKKELATEISAIEHLKMAKSLLHQKEGYLMIQGRQLTEQELKQYEFLMSVGSELTAIINRLEVLDIK